MMTLRLLAAAGCVSLAACGSVPNDVNTAGSNGQIGGAEVLSTAPPATGGIPTAAGATGDVTFLDPDDLAARAEGAINAADATSSGAATGGGVLENIQPMQASDQLPPPLIPRVAAFALRTTHSVGQQMYRRNPLRRDGRSECAQFPTRDQAQDRFLADGGPERDRNGWDPDGDGFVCGFDPADLRASAAAPAETFDALPAINDTSLE